MAVDPVVSEPFWTPALIVSILSLCWSAGNTIYTARLQGRVREAAVRLAEFNANVRAPITKRLSELDEQRRVILALRHSGKDDPGVREDLKPLNQKFVDTIGGLQDALTRAQASSFAGKEKWLDGFDEFETSALGLLDKAINPTRSRDDLKKAIEELSSSVLAHEALINGRCDRIVQSCI